MARVICDMSMSLDGYVTGPNDSRDNPFGDGAHTLHDWLSARRDRRRPGPPGRPPGRHRRARDGTHGPSTRTRATGAGATAGRTVKPRASSSRTIRPDRQHPPMYTFVTDGVAVGDRAGEGASPARRSVALFGATVMQQALPLGLVDEFCLHVVPVLIGGGTPLFATLTEAISLERTAVVATPGATHLRFTVTGKIAS